MEKVDGKAIAKPPDFDKLWNNDHPGTTERRLRELLPSAFDSRDLSYFAQLLTQIAKAEGMQRRLEDAHKTLDRVEKVLSRVDHKTKVRYLLERGRLFSSSGKGDDARPLFHESLDLAIASKEDLYAVDAARMIPIIEPAEKQLQWNLKALALAEESADERAKSWLGPLYHNIGWAYFNQGMYEEALYMFEKALEFREHQGDASRVRIERWCVAKVQRVMGRTEEAFEMQRQLVQEYEAAGRRNGHVYEEIGECLLVMGREEEAQGWFAAAYVELSKQPDVTRDQDHLNRLKELGKVGRSNTEYGGN